MQGFILLLLLTFSASSVFAVTTPTFPSCANPQGTIRVEYGKGIHGIIGETTIYTGNDAVYSLSEDTLLQCFCSVGGDGIQTNWWKVSSLTEVEVNSLLAQGWQKVPNGSLWGLEEAPYLAINADYGCRPAVEVQSSTVFSNGDPGDSNGSSPDTTGEVLAAVTSVAGEVLGLADTGNSWKPYLLAGFGLIFVWLGFGTLRKP